MAAYTPWLETDAYDPYNPQQGYSQQPVQQNLQNGPGFLSYQTRMRGANSQTPPPSAYPFPATEVADNRYGEAAYWPANSPAGSSNGGPGALQQLLQSSQEFVEPYTPQPQPPPQQPPQPPPRQPAPVTDPVGYPDNVAGTNDVYTPAGFEVRPDDIGPQGQPLEHMTPEQRTEYEQRQQQHLPAGTGPFVPTTTHSPLETFTVGTTSLAQQDSGANESATEQYQDMGYNTDLSQNAASFFPQGPHGQATENESPTRPPSLPDESGSSEMADEVIVDGAGAMARLLRMSTSLQLRLPQRRQRGSLAATASTTPRRPRQQTHTTRRRVESVILHRKPSSILLSRKCLRTKQNRCWNTDEMGHPQAAT